MMTKMRYQRMSGARGTRDGYTLLEMMVVLVVMAIAGTMALAVVSEVDRSERPNRAAKEMVTALRYARMLAMTTGKVCGVQTNTTAGVNQFLVYRVDVVGATSTQVTVNEPMGAGGVYAVALGTQSELAGTTMVVTPAGTGGVTKFSYDTLGTAGVTGTVQFVYGGRSKTVTIPAVGEATIN